MDIIRIILSSGLPCCLLAIGIFLTFKILDFADMTAEGSFLIAGVVCLSLIKGGLNAYLATFIAILSGGVCGFITGILNRVLKIPKLLSGIITMTASASIALAIMGGANGESFASLVNVVNEKTIFSILDPKVFHGWNNVIIMAVIVIIAFAIVYFFFGTEYGMAIRATGMNETMAKAQGINTDVSTVACVTIANAIIGLAGAISAQSLKTVSATSATGYLIVGLASILIGEAVFGNKDFKRSLISVCLGSIVYFAIIQLAISVFGMPSDLNKLLYAILITIALCLPAIKKWVKNLFTKNKKEKVKSNA